MEDLSDDELASIERSLVGPGNVLTSRSETCRMLAELQRLRAEVAALTTRRDELLALVAKLTRETPYPEELDECRSARAALIAEVGTLRSELAELRGQIADAFDGDS